MLKIETRTDATAAPKANKDVESEEAGDERSVAKLHCSNEHPASLHSCLAVFMVAELQV